MQKIISAAILGACIATGAVHAADSENWQTVRLIEKELWDHFYDLYLSELTVVGQLKACQKEQIARDVKTPKEGVIAALVEHYETKVAPGYEGKLPEPTDVLEVIQSVIQQGVSYTFGYDMALRLALQTNPVTSVICYSGMEQAERLLASRRNGESKP